MRSALLSFAFSLAALQAPIPYPSDLVRQLVTVLSLFGAVTSAAVAVYKLGGWRQKMSDVESAVTAELQRVREELSRAAARLEDRVSVLERGVAGLERSQVRVEATVASMEARVGRLEASERREAA